MRVTLTVLAALLILAFAHAGPAAAACGQETSAYPQHWDGGGAPPLVIGDSVLYDVVPALAQLGFQADAMVCRQFSQGLALLAQRAGTLPHLVVLELGTNGTVTEQQIDAALAILGPHRLLALITPHNGVVPADDQIIMTARSLHPAQILVLDWNQIADGHPEWFGGDGIHLGSEAGITAFAAMVATVLPYAAQPPCGS